ncbi:MAG: ABC transporter substrate-binding protein [Candidatus Helarchaeota archaeon]
MAETNKLLIGGLIAAMGIAAFIPIYFISFASSSTALWPLLIDLQTKNYVMDGQGRLVAVPKHPNRIISLGPSNTEILFNISCEKSRIVAITDQCDYPISGQNNISGIPQIPNGYWSPDPTDIIVYNPDLVIGRPVSGHINIISNLEAAGIAFFIMPAENAVDDIFTAMDTIGFLVDKRSNAQTEVNKLENAMEKITNSQNGTGNSTLLPVKARTYYDIGTDAWGSFYFAGGSTFIDDLINKAGGLNLGAYFAGSWPHLNVPGAEMAAQDPEHIAFNQEYQDWTTISSRSGWSGVTAVINNNYTAMNPDIIERPGPRIIDALYILAKDLCPNIMTWY